MLKKLAIGLATGLVLIIVIGFVFQQQIMIYLIESQIGPEHGFDAGQVPSPPVYSDDAFWAALPGKEDPSDSVPENAPEYREDTGVAVFFIHPTSYIKKDNWNQPLDDSDANWIVDHRVLRHQASVFSGCCEVYAPRYRQATFFSFLDQDGHGEMALEVAYTDVSRAFDDFLRRIGNAPFILALQVPTQ